MINRQLRIVETVEGKRVPAPGADFYLCSDGMAHKWLYLGFQVKAYRCERCAAQVTKSDLKEITDPIPLVPPGR